MWRLQVKARPPYSPLQRELFELLPQNGDQVGTKDLVFAKLKRGPWDVRRPRHIISVTMQRLQARMERHREPFVLRRTTGPRSQETKYWLEPRRTRRSSLAGSTRISLLD
jgi:hypothetical protein